MSMSSNQPQLTDEARHLALVPLFSQLEERDLATLAEEVDQVSFKSGETIFHAFDQGDALYLVESGSVRIWVHDDDVQQITLSELKPGDFFGELAVLDKGERSANATAITDTFFLARYSGENGAQFDPYPYILLNLMLSMTAAMQAPVILMSQKRATQRDRFAAEEDFKVNLKSELMLDDLTRNDRQRSIQLEELTSVMKNIQDRTATQDRDRLTVAVAD